MGPTDKMFGYINGVLKMGDPPSHHTVGCFNTKLIQFLDDLGYHPF